MNKEVVKDKWREEVEWITKDVGRLSWIQNNKYFLYKVTIYSRWYFICREVVEALFNIVKEGRVGDDDLTIGWGLVYKMCSFQCYPQLNAFECHVVEEYLTTLVRKAVGLLRLWEDKEEKEDDLDFTFLLKIGLKRKWYESCFLCFEDMKCGKAIMFRPCGHTICAGDCFNNFANNNKDGFGIGKGGVERFANIASSVLREDLKEVKCPVCRTRVKEVFRCDKVIPSGKEMDLFYIHWDGIDEFLKGLGTTVSMSRECKENKKREREENQ